MTAELAVVILFVAAFVGIAMTFVGDPGPRIRKGTEPTDHE